MTTKLLKVTIEWKLLERIAEFYEFPTAVFLSDMDNFNTLPQTRRKSLSIKAEKFDRIKDITEES